MSGFASGTWSAAIKAALVTAFGANGLTSGTYAQNQQSMSDAIANSFLNSKGWNVSKLANYVACSAVGPSTTAASGTTPAVGGGTLLLLFSGTCFASAIGAMGLSLVVNGVTLANTTIWANVAAQHMAIPTVGIVWSPAASGGYSWSISTLANSNTDGGDHIDVTMIEMPF